MEDMRAQSFSFCLPVEEVIALKRFLLQRGTSLNRVLTRIVVLICNNDPRIVKLIDEEVEALRIERTRKPEASPLIHVSQKSIYEALAQNDPLERTRDQQ